MFSRETEILWNLFIGSIIKSIKKRFPWLLSTKNWPLHYHFIRRLLEAATEDTQCRVANHAAFHGNKRHDTLPIVPSCSPHLSTHVMAKQQKFPNILSLHLSSILNGLAWYYFVRNNHSNWSNNKYHVSKLVNAYSISLALPSTYILSRCSQTAKP